MININMNTECEKCDRTMQLRENCEPTPICDACAQDELARESSRLDWLSEHPEITIYKGLFNGQMQWWLHRITPHNIQYNSLREAIDAAMLPNV